MEKSIDEILEECYNLHCHEGTFNLLGHTINVFTKEEIYPTTKEGIPDFTKEPLSYGGHKCAFIDNTYWTGWYYPDLGNDLKECMKEVTKEILEKSNFKCSFEVTYEDELNEEYSNLDDLKNHLLLALKSNLNSSLIEDESLIITNIDNKNNKFHAICNLCSRMMYYLFTDEESLTDEYYYSENITDIKCSIDHEQEIEDFFEKAFNYTLSF